MTACSFVGGSSILHEPAAATQLQGVIPKRPQSEFSPVSKPDSIFSYIVRQMLLCHLYIVYPMFKKLNFAAESVVYYLM
jgi:hypothetical protein